MLAARRMMNAQSGPVVYVGTGVNQNDNTGGTSISATLPTALAAGDLMLLQVAVDVAMPNTPTGWTLALSGSRCRIFTKTAAVGETASTVTFPSNPGDRTTVLRAYRGGAAGTPAVAVSAMNSVTSSSSCTAGQPSYTGDAMCVYFWNVQENFSAHSIVTPGSVGNVAGTGAVVVFAKGGDEALTLTGTTPARTATSSGAGFFDGATFVLV